VINDWANHHTVVLYVAAFTCSGILVFFYMNFYQVRRAFQWWSGRQFRQQWLESDRIRNSVMQDLFALYRGIEISQLQGADTILQNSKIWLEQAGQIQRSLEQLSHHLSPLFLEDSLPLAIQATISDWQEKTQHSIEVKMPSDWQANVQEQNQMILSTLVEILHMISSHQLSSPDSVEYPIQICLAQRGNLAELLIQIEGAQSEGEAIVCSKEWIYLRRCFHYLTGGKCTYRYKKDTLTWCLRW
jgi:hypothetical protein